MDPMGKSVCFFSGSALWDGVRTGTPTGPADHGGPTEISWGAPVGRCGKFGTWKFAVLK